MVDGELAALVEPAGHPDAHVQDRVRGDPGGPDIEDALRHAPLDEFAVAALVVAAATGGVGADAVLDFVGATATLELAAATLRPGGELALVGGGGGQLTVRKPGFRPPGFRLSLPYWGTRPELAEVIAPARSGALRVETDHSPLSAAPQAFDRLRRGGVRGRVVLVPD